MEDKGAASGYRKGVRVVGRCREDDETKLGGLSAGEVEGREVGGWQGDQVGGQIDEEGRGGDGAETDALFEG